MLTGNRQLAQPANRHDRQWCFKPVKFGLAERGLGQIYGLSLIVYVF